MSENLPKSPGEVKLEEYAVPDLDRCKKSHGYVKPEPKAQITKDGNPRVGIYCPKCLDRGASGYIRWVPKKAEFYTRKEKLFALKYAPGQRTKAGLEVPTPRYNRTLTGHRCLNCPSRDARWSVLAWNKYQEAIRTFLCSDCKRRLEAYHRSKRRAS